MNVWAPIWEYRGLLLSGFGLTLALTVVTIITSIVVGFVLGLLRATRVRWLSVVLRIYLEIFRGSPLLIQILFIYFGAAYLHLPAFNTFVAAAVAVTLYHSALISEVFRAGFESVPAGQLEAGQSLGMSRFAINRYIVWPQAMRVVGAPLVGVCIALVKNTTLASVIGYEDLLFQGQGIVEGSANPFVVFAVVAVGYFIICYPMSLIAKKLERRNAVYS